MVPGSGIPDGDARSLAEVLGSALADLAPFDRVHLAAVIRICRASRSASEAGRALFSVSRLNKASSNDADRLRKYLSRFGTSFDAVQSSH
jgi:transcriptional regulatory protein RtcR